MPAAVRNRSGTLCAILSCAIVGGGCDTAPIAGKRGTSGGYAQARALTPAEQRLRQESAPLDAKTSIQGCLAGAAAGALLGMLAGRDRDNRSKGVMIGAAVGCGVGVGVNAYVQSKRRQYQNEEQRMESMIADVRADNRRLAGLISTSKDVMAADRRKIAEIDKAYARKSISANEARQQLTSVKANRDHLRKTLGSLKKKEGDWAQISNLERGAGSDTTELDTEIEKLKTQVSTLEKEVTLMDKRINASPVAA